MELFHEISDNTYNIIRYRNKDKVDNKFKLKYPVYFNDTVSDLLKKIAISISDEINDKYIFAFIQQNKITDTQISELEKKIIPNDTIRELLKKSFSDIG